MNDQQECKTSLKIRKENPTPLNKPKLRSRINAMTDDFSDDEQILNVNLDKPITKLHNFITTLTGTHRL